MGKLRCTCGLEIAKTSDEVAYKANFIPGEAYVDFCERMNKALDLLLENCKDKERRVWIQNQLGEDYPEGISNADMLLDYFSKEIFDLAKKIYQCVGCQRIWIQQGNSIRYTSFIPESLEKSKNILGFKFFENWSQN